MNDGGFDFTPAQRKAPKQFEPPPWEREAFEELAQRRGEQEVADASAVAISTDEHAPDRLADVLAAQPKTTTVAAVEASASRERPASSAAVDEAQVLEMLVGLKAQEPTQNRVLSTAGLAVAALCGVMGTISIVWALAAGFKASKATSNGDVAAFGAVVLGLFGMLFIGLAGWLWFKVMRQRGVL